MTNIRVDMSGTSARTLDGLSRLIAARQKWLGESSKDAVIATAIDALLSVRTATSSAKKKKSTRPTIEHCPGLRASCYGGRSSPRRVIRFASGGGRFEARRVRWLNKGLKDSEAKVFKVTPEHDKIEPYYVVCASMSDAKRFENLAAVHRMKRFGNLAKWAFGVSMNKLSTKNVHDDVTGEANHAASRLSSVKKSEVGKLYAVLVEDSLDYAEDALRGGRAAVDVAIKKAANKIAGRIMHKWGDALGDDFKTPFPEVRRNRK